MRINDCIHCAGSGELVEVVEVSADGEMAVTRCICPHCMSDLPMPDEHDDETRQAVSEFTDLMRAYVRQYLRGM